MLILLVVVRRMSVRFGMREVGEDEDWTLYWVDRFRKLKTKSDSADALERCRKMKSYQVTIQNKSAVDFVVIRLGVICFKVMYFALIVPCFK